MRRICFRSNTKSIRLRDACPIVRAGWAAPGEIHRKRRACGVRLPSATEHICHDGSGVVASVIEAGKAEARLKRLQHREVRVKGRALDVFGLSQLIGEANVSRAA
jgi:hypothetical protein